MTMQNRDAPDLEARLAASEAARVAAEAEAELRRRETVELRETLSLKAGQVRDLIARAEKAEAALAETRKALVEHNDNLRSAFQAAQRDAIHEVNGTTRYGAMADVFDRTLRKHHTVTNEARAALTTAAGDGT